MKKIAFTLTVILCSYLVDKTYAETICLKSKIKKGKLVTTTATVSDGQKCPKGFKPLFSSTSITTIGGNGAQGLKGDTGAQGPAGPQGSVGPQGPIGPQGPQGGYRPRIAVSAISDSNSVSPKTVGAACPANTTFITGSTGVIDGLAVPYNGPVALSYAGGLVFSQTYYVRAYETTATNDTWQLFAVAICEQN